MIIDFHTHIFPEKIASLTVNALKEKSGNTPYTDGTDCGLVMAMQRANADLCITLPVLTKPTQFESVSKFAIEINKKYVRAKNRLISFGGIHPDCDNIYEKLLYLKDNGILGVKIHPDYQQTYIDDPKYIEIIKTAKELDLIVVTHAGIDDGYKGRPVMCPPERIINVIDKVGHSKLVLAHFGAHKQWQEVLSKIAGKDVYFDTAFTMHEIDKQIFIDIISKHGSDKILFATDCPWRDIKTDYDIIKSYNLDKETEDNIFYRNALKLLNLQEK